MSRTSDIHNVNPQIIHDLSAAMVLVKRSKTNNEKANRLVKLHAFRQGWKDQINDKTDFDISILKMIISAYEMGKKSAILSGARKSDTPYNQGLVKNGIKDDVLKTVLKSKILSRK